MVAGIRPGAAPSRLWDGSGLFEKLRQGDGEPLAGVAPTVERGVPRASRRCGESRGERISVKAGEKITVRAEFTGATPTVRIQR